MCSAISDRTFAFEGRVDTSLPTPIRLASLTRSPFGAAASALWPGSRTFAGAPFLLLLLFAIGKLVGGEARV